MAIADDKIQEALAVLRKHYPNWSGFTDPDFAKEEVDYKQATIAKARELLNKEALEALVDQARFDKFIDRLDKIGKDNNLLWRVVPRDGDLNILYVSNLDRAGFCRAMLDLLYGSGPSPERLGRYIDYVVSNRLPNKWTFPTYFLFICNPSEEMFIKPMAVRTFLQLIGREDLFSSKPTSQAYAAFKGICRELWQALEAYGPRDMVDIQGFIWAYASLRREHPAGLVTPDKREKCAKWFAELLEEYLPSAEGQSHVRLYDEARRQARENFDLICQAADRGDEDITDLVLLRLLPHAESRSNLAKGAWIHWAPVVRGDLKLWFEGLGRTEPEAWPKVSRALLRFVRRCVEDPGQFTSALAEFTSEECSKGFQSALVSPILNALRPDDFLVVNMKSRQVVNYLAGTKHSQNLNDYQKVNDTERQLIEELADVLNEAGGPLSSADTFDLFCHWLVAVKKVDLAEVHYWKIDAGEQAWEWEESRTKGFVAIGWGDIGDVSGLSKADFRARWAEVSSQHADWAPGTADQIWSFANIREGDRIIASKGTKEVLGIGTVIGPYFFVPDVRHGHRLPVMWEDTRRRVVNRPGWKKTIIKLSAEEFAEVLNAEELAEVLSAEDIREMDSAFSERAFELLAGLHDNPTSQFYGDHKADFKQYVENPFQNLMFRVREKLLPPLKRVLETERGIFSRIIKNDYGRGGAWTFYWGAFYPKQGKRNTDAQLSLWINRDRLEYGFYIGDCGTEQQARFQRNCERNLDALLSVLKDTLSDTRLVFGKRDNEGKPLLRAATEGRGPSWRDWLADVRGYGIDVSVVMKKDEVLRLPADELADRIASTYAQLFPLVLLTVSDDPLRDIEDYIEDGPPDGPNPEYSLEDCASETGFDIGLLRRWVNAIERKGQAIVYGPPGTGKTYIAEKLAKHLIAGGRGFSEVVQFHPAYAYEDFVQGLRPKRVDGGLDYPLVSGRFLEFCRKASKTSDRCVLIIDEINRANLARVFGELMYLLEYRDRQVPLASGGLFSVPINVRIIGTMNTADRSIALVDHALRRRFAFLALRPDYDMLRKYHQRTGFAVDGLIETLRRLNIQIDNPHYEVGISFFLRKDLEQQIEDIWRMEIEPYLEEYFVDQRSKAEDFCWDKVAHRICPQRQEAPESFS